MDHDKYIINIVKRYSGYFKTMNDEVDLLEIEHHDILQSLEKPLRDYFMIWMPENTNIKIVYDEAVPAYIEMKIHEIFLKHFPGASI